MEVPKSTTEIAEKLGINRFELVSLLSKRIRELMYGAHPLVENNDTNLIEIAFKELISNKIKPVRKTKSKK